MSVKLFFNFMSTLGGYKEKAWRWWYQRLAKDYRKDEWKFMNYGYASLDAQPLVPLTSEEDEKNRLFIQLYQHVLGGIDLREKHMLEVGCGRGGGADYFARTASPASVVGIDLSKNNIELCNTFYHVPGLNFMEGSAEKIPFPDETFDVVYNVESSHCYADMKAFVAEVKRVLKKGGEFAWADLRLVADMKKDDAIFMESGLELVSKEDITKNVVKALDIISDYKVDEIKKNVPWVLRHIFYEFTGIKDSKIYRGFQDGTMIYMCYRLRNEIR